MPLSAGDKLGPYQIVSPLGAGGMGEVYKARDPRLDRFVAIKVLPEHIAKREDLRQRFEREARAVASLNHPNICVLHDIGNQDGTGFMVMEYLEGETVAARVARGAIPLEQSVKLASQIADALDRAHRAGVTHRDIKPSNVMLTRDGVKVLDFGLAKSAPKPGPSESTLTAALTTEGSILGTPQYMAPEQFEGKEADARSDIWAFGAVLYEMVTGRKAFQGKSYASMLGAILSADPPPMTVRPFTPVGLERLVKRCLQKDPEDRYQSMRDVQLDLRCIPAESEPEAKAPTARPWAAWALAGLTTAVAAVLAGWVWYGTANTPQPVLRTMVTLPVEAPLVTSFLPAVALSPDGMQMVYAGGSAGKTQLFLRRLDEPDVKAIPGTQGADGPFFSPDGAWLGFFAQGKLKKIPVTGGIAVTLCDAPEPYGGSWAPDNTVVFVPRSFAGLYRIPAGGGAPKLLTKPDVKRGERGHGLPQVLPDGRTVLFTSWNASGFAGNRISAVAIDGQSPPKMVIDDATDARYAPSGHLIFMRSSALFAAPFDAGRFQVTGNPIAVLEGLRSSEGAAQFDVSPSGSAVYVPGGSSGTQFTLVWVDRDGKTRPITQARREYEDLDLSPDGKRLALTMEGAEADIWIYDFIRDSLTRLTSGGGNRDCIWTPDGKRVVYNASHAFSNLFWKPVDGSGAEERLTTSPNDQSAYSFTPDGKSLILSETDTGTGVSGFWVLDMATRKVRPLLKSANFARLSHDGRWLAYYSDESGQTQVYVQAYPDLGARYQVSTDGGSEPLWSPDDKELFYRNENKVMAVSVKTQPAFSAGKPVLLFQGAFRWTGRSIATPDGKRFVMMQPVEQTSPQTQVNLVLNWSGELKRKVR